MNYKTHNLIKPTEEESMQYGLSDYYKCNKCGVLFHVSGRNVFMSYHNTTIYNKEIHDLRSLSCNEIVMMRIL
jgi:hypothetical protein